MEGLGWTVAKAAAAPTTTGFKVGLSDPCLATTTYYYDEGGLGVWISPDGGPEHKNEINLVTFSNRTK